MSTTTRTPSSSWATSTSPAHDRRLPDDPSARYRELAGRLGEVGLADLWVRLGVGIGTTSTGALNPLLTARPRRARRRGRRGGTTTSPTHPTRSAIASTSCGSAHRSTEVSHPGVRAEVGLPPGGRRHPPPPQRPPRRVRRPHLVRRLIPKWVGIRREPQVTPRRSNPLPDRSRSGLGSERVAQVKYAQIQPTSRGRRR